MKRFLLLMICLLCCFTLSACYVDNDPWPASVPVDPSPTAAVTAMPTQEPAAPAVHLTPSPEPAPAETLVPQLTAEPAPATEETPAING